MSAPKTITAVVVSYNRKLLLKECLEGLLSQTRPLDAIIIIDNASTDGTKDLLTQEGYLNNPKIIYHELSTNLGSSGGFYEGVKYASEKGYDWFWLMDDDAEPQKDALEKLLIQVGTRDDISMAGCAVKTGDEVSLPHRGIIQSKKAFPSLSEAVPISLYHKDAVEIGMVSFVGMLVSARAVAKAGFPKKELFIHHDDVEYSLRLSTVGKILLVPDSIIMHKEGMNKGIYFKKLFGRQFMRFYYQNLWILYYGLRNSIWLGKKYAAKPQFYVDVLLLYIKKIIAIVLIDDHKYKRICFITNAFYDGLMGNFDNTKPKKILYGNTH